MMTSYYYLVQRFHALRRFWDLKKNALCEIRVSGTVGGTNAKIPHLRVHKSKIAVVGSAVVKTMQMGPPCKLSISEIQRTTF